MRNKTWADDEKLAFEVWKYYRGIGGADKDRMIQIAIWLLGFSAAIIGFYATDKLADPLATVLLIVIGILVSLLAAFVALLYGSYAAWNWSIADQIACNYEWTELKPDYRPFKSAWKEWFAKPCEDKIAPVFWVFFWVSLGSFIIQVFLLYEVYEALLSKGVEAMDPIDLILTILGAAGGTGIIIAGLSAWLGKVWANRIAEAQKQALKIATEIDLDLRERRIKVYKELWEATSILPKWPRAEDVTYEKLNELSVILRAWYFQKGGMYLSRKAHEQGYSPLQDALAELLKLDLSGNLSEKHYNFIREKCSTLRTRLIEDIESRRTGPL